MVSSWLSSNTETTQDTSGVEAIKSLFRSLNLNRARLPGTLTFRDEPPGPDKSLCQIVSRISNSVDIESKAVKGKTFDFVQHNTVKNDSQESCNLNSRTESAIQSLSTRTSGEKNDVIYAGESLKQNHGNCGRIFKHAALDAESLETIKKWGSARAFIPNIGDINNDTYIGLNTSQKKIVSTCWPSTSVTSTPNNFHNKHWPNYFINGENIFNPQNNHNNQPDSEQLFTPTHSFLEHPREPRPHFSEYLDNKQTQMHSTQKKQEQLVNIRRKNTLKKAKRLLEKVSRDKLSIDLDAIANGTKVKSAKIKNPYHRIHLSINNYFNSPRDSPLISPKRSELHEEVIDEREKNSYGKNIKVISKRKSLGNITRGKQQNKSIILTEKSEDNNETESEAQSPTELGSQEVTKQVDVGHTSDKSSSDNHPIENKKISKVTFELNSSTDCSAVAGINDKPSLANNCVMNSQHYRRSKMDNTKNRLEAVLCGERRTVAKPSEILIPHSVRARHIFQAFANIPEQPETKVQPIRSVKKKPGHLVNDQCASGIKISTDPACKLNAGKKLSPVKHTTACQDSQNPKQVVENYTNASFKRNAKKQDNELLVESNVPVVRSKTFIATPRYPDVSRLTEDCQRLLEVHNESNGMTEGKKFENRHSRSLRMLKELLANTDNESITEESCGHSEERVNIDKPIKSIPMNNMESQTCQKPVVTQSLQTLSEVIEHSDISTETDAHVSQCQKVSMNAGHSFNKFACVSSDHPNQMFVDAQVACSFPSIVPFNEDLSHAAVKSYRMIETQTSRTSIQASCKNKKDTSVETVQLRLQSKYVNTEQRVLIDSSTGKDVLELQNFCCDTQLTNTESTMFDDHSIHDLKLRINGVETQMNSLKSLINIGIQNTSTDICAGLISSLSNQIISTGRLSSGSERRGNSPELPDEVIRAFEIAAEKAQNLHRAIEIYREHEMKKQYEFKPLSEENQQEKSKVNLLREEGCKSQSLIVALEHISESEKALQEGLTKLVLHQEVQFTLETLLDQVAKEVKKSNMKLRKLIPDNTERSVNKIDSEWICDLEKCSLESMPPTSRTKILPIVYGAVCTLIFWSLQYSTSCEFG